MNINPDKKLFSVFEIYNIAVKGFRSISFFRKGKKSGFLTAPFQERIMLAVTAVNQCPMCSYAHTEMALQAGLSESEIDTLVRGEFPDISKDEIKAVLFAQHYADKRGKPSLASWKQLVEYYGYEQSCSILAAIRIIMTGNAFGIPAGSIKERLSRRKPDPRSSLSYELVFILLFIPILLIAFLHATLCGLFRYPYAHFK